LTDHKEQNSGVPVLVHLPETVVQETPPLFKLVVEEARNKAVDFPLKDPFIHGPVLVVAPSKASSVGIA
jgi:hypothetical protein